LRFLASARSLSATCENRIFIHLRQTEVHRLQS
jgi:hypothetical protein